ncbi:uncharacterized protein SCHCODRAFT_02481220 [Schizophyllum commune H4-8]|uniref:uncharacterized protein n=1 Tax=Schizophyllum commune (strain H4-8 / FGSC 9210) TaxID=578458 RepID=UPI00215FE40F|nr:uncharacterized protein SCHCODRAFT_02481220 [Schizophyllum commune H4-8]KAI5899690.1 hypothetical protein SCHCODRAFT_02481220 [Schizophyllum commune H4-8]
MHRIERCRFVAMLGTMKAGFARCLCWRRYLSRRLARRLRDSFECDVRRECDPARLARRSACIRLRTSFMVVRAGKEPHRRSGWASGGSRGSACGAVMQLAGNCRTQLESICFRDETPLSTFVIPLIPPSPAEKQSSIPLSGVVDTRPTLEHTVATILQKRNQDLRLLCREWSSVRGLCLWPIRRVPADRDMQGNHPNTPNPL